MTVTYSVQAINMPGDVRVEALQQSLAATLRSHGLHLSLAVEVAGDVPSDCPVVGVFFGSADARLDPACCSAAADAVRAGRVVIPVVASLDHFSEEIPGEISRFNGYSWDEDGPEGLARVLLEELGIEERQRRVFISHRRSDAILMAEQLHDALSHHRFEPFVDRFAIASGRDVQHSIADCLEDFAFLLLLESPEASNSEWVLYEVEYALSHTMGLCILHWPNAAKVPGTEGLPRIPLETTDLVDRAEYQLLTAEAVQRVVAQVEQAHAQGLVRRRRSLLVSVQEAAMGAGRQPVSLTGWRLLLKDMPEEIVGVAPRLPTVDDLYGLDQRKEEVIGSSGRSVLVHAARNLEESRRSVLKWAVGKRGITLVPENAIGAYW